jgi:hypothetical protein
MGGSIPLLCYFYLLWKKKKKNQQTHYLAYTIQEDQVFINPYQHATFLSLYVPQSCNLQKKKNVTTK